jgi:hypothetical protein
MVGVCLRVSAAWWSAAMCLILMSARPHASGDRDRDGKRQRKPGTGSVTATCTGSGTSRWAGRAAMMRIEEQLRALGEIPAPVPDRLARQAWAVGRQRRRAARARTETGNPPLGRSTGSGLARTPRARCRHTARTQRPVRHRRPQATPRHDTQPTSRPPSVQRRRRP